MAAAILSENKQNPVAAEPGETVTACNKEKKFDLLGPLRILLSNQAAPIIIFLAVYYAVWQMSITAVSFLFKSLYGLTEIQIGLTFMANGVGSMVGTLATGKILDIDYRRVKSNYGASFDSEQGTIVCQASREDNFPLENARLRLVPIFATLQCILYIPVRPDHPIFSPSAYCSSYCLDFYFGMDSYLYAISYRDIPRRRLP